jgi:hypothetical protein
MKLDRMGVFVLMSHLLITLAILGVYWYTIHIGQADETLKTVLTVIVGYWFGSMGSQAIRGKKDSNRGDDDE